DRPHGLGVRRSRRAARVAPARDRGGRAGADALRPDALQPDPRRRHQRATRGAARRRERARDDREPGPGRAPERSGVVGVLRHPPWCRGQGDRRGGPRCLRGLGGRPHEAHRDHRPVPRRVAGGVPPRSGALLSRPGPEGQMNRYPTSDVLMAEAMELTGLTDFGPGDFREGLDVLLESLEHDGDLSPATDGDVIGAFRRRLANRLEAEAWYREHPEIAGLPVRGPVDIHGLPRTGTTALANMMSLDPQFRCLRGWEQAKPCPPPTLDGEASDPRRLQFVRDYEQLPPALRAMHIHEVDATMEDTEL